MLVIHDNYRYKEQNLGRGYIYRQSAGLLRILTIFLGFVRTIRRQKEGSCKPKIVYAPRLCPLTKIQVPAHPGPKPKPASNSTHQVRQDIVLTGNIFLNVMYLLQSSPDQPLVGVAKQVNLYIIYASM